MTTALRPAPSARIIRPMAPELPSSIHIQRSATATQLTTYALKMLARTNAMKAPGLSTSSAIASPRDIVPVTTIAL